MRLSSSLSFLIKFGSPLAFVISVAAWYFGTGLAQAPHRFGAIALWSVVGGWALWWVRGIKQVDLKDGKFLISNFRTVIEVPTDQLV